MQAGVAPREDGNAMDCLPDTTSNSLQSIGAVSAAPVTVNTSSSTAFPTPPPPTLNTYLPDVPTAASSQSFVGTSAP